MDDEDDLSNYRPGMGAMVAMGYEGGPEFEGFEAFDMSHTWSPGTPPGMPHGPFDEPDKMGWEHERYQRQGVESRLFERGVGWKDEFGDDDSGTSDPSMIDPGAALGDPDLLVGALPVPFYGMPQRPGWGAWQRPGTGRFAGRRR